MSPTLDIDDLGSPAVTIDVLPSDNIFRELGDNTYTFVDLLSELIDNSIAAARPDVLLLVQVAIHLDEKNTPVTVVVRDNASGIPRDLLAKAISPAALQKEESLNEHGLGMKQAVASLGTLRYLATKTEGEQRARVVTRFKYGDLDVYERDVEWDAGTEIVVDDVTTSLVPSTQQGITMSVEPMLGARYRRFLRPDNKKARIVIELHNYDGSVQRSWDISEVKPIYFHRATRTNSPIIERYELSGNGWRARLTFGYAPKSEEYEELGLTPPPPYHPYYVSLAKQGLDVFRTDRLILFHKLAEIGVVESQHPQYNLVRGEIDLDEGFRTSITKNALVSDEHLDECLMQIADILNGRAPGPDGVHHDYLEFRTAPTELPERLLRDRLAAWLPINPLDPKQSVERERAVGGIDGHIDILADGEAWELKIDMATAYDVFQLFMYMDVDGLSKGFLVAPDFKPSAVFAAKHLDSKHGVEVKLVKLDQLPITEPPTDDERKKYFH